MPKTLSIPVRWADNTKELRANLAQGLNQIEVTRASVDKLAGSLGGDKLIRASHNYVAALQQMGKEGGALRGVEMLTNNERERGIALLDKTIAKYKALGQEAPTALKEIAAAAKSANAAAEAAAKKPTGLAGLLGDGPLSGLIGKIGGVGALAGGLGIGVTAAGALQFGKALLDDADALEKMSDRTGISVTWLQKFQVAGDDAGNTVEEMTQGINQMQKRLVGGDSSFQAALATLHIDLGRFRALAPEQQFVEISDAIRKIHDPAVQAQIAIALFGKSGAELLPTLKRGIDDVRDATVGMSESTTFWLDKAGDAWKKFYRTIKGEAGNAIVDTLVGLIPNSLLLTQQQVADRRVKRSLPGLTPKSPYIYGSGLPTIDPFAVNDASESFDHLINRMEEEQKAAKEANDEFDEMLKRFDLLQLVVPKVAASVKDINFTALAHDFQSSRLIDGFMNPRPKGMLEPGNLNLLNRPKVFNPEEGGISTVWSMGVNIDNQEVLLPRISLLGKIMSEEEAIAEFARTHQHLGIFDTPENSDAYAEALHKQQEGLINLSESEQQALAKHELFVAGMTLPPSQTFGLSEEAASQIGQRWVMLMTGVNHVADDYGGTMLRLQHNTDTFVQSFSSSFGKLPGVIVGAFQGGGNPLKAATSLIGGDLGKHFGDQWADAIEHSSSPMFRKVENGLSQQVTPIFGRLLKGVAKNVVPIVGSLIGPILGGIGHLFGFGESEGEKTNRMRDGIVAAAGGINQLNAEAQKAGLTLDDFLRADRVDTFTAAWTKLKDAIAFSGQALDALSAAEDEYGYTATANSAKLFQQYKDLQAAGHPVDDIAKRMGGGFRQLVQDAIKAGTALPRELQPILEILLRNGQLVDENGFKLKDLSKITFGEVGDSAESAFQKTTDGINKLVAAIKVLAGIPLTWDDQIALGMHPAPEGHTSSGGSSGYGIPDAPKGASSGQGGGWLWDAANKRWIPTPFSAPGMSTGGLVTASGVQHFASGGMVGRDTVPAWLMPGEIVLNPGQQAGLASRLQMGGGGSAVIHTHVYLNEREIVRAVAPALPGELWRRGVRV